MVRRAGAAVVAVMIAVSAGPAWAGDRSQDAFRVYDQSVNYGRGMSHLSEGGGLGWSEYVFVEGYANQYDATGDTAWLDKIVDHADRMIPNAYDHDGDGYKGWPDLRYAHNQVKNRYFDHEAAPAGAANLIGNGGFETGGAVPTGWQQTGSAARSRRSTAAADVFAGVAGAVVESDGTNQNRLVAPLTYVAGKRYVVEGFVGIDTGSTQARLEVFNATTGRVVAFERSHHAGFEYYAFTFIAPASGTLHLRLGLESYVASGWRARFDSVSVRQLGDTPPGIARTDAAGWHRAATPLAAAHRTNDPAAKTEAMDWVVELVSDGTGIPQVSQFLHNYRPGRRYAFSASLRGPAGGMRVVDETDGRVLVDEQFASTSFSSRFVYFTTPAAGHRLRVDIYLPQSASGTKLSAYDMFGGELWEQQVHEGNVLTPILRFVNAVYDDPALGRYRAKADAYLAFVADNFVHKWDPYWRQLTGTDGANNGSGVYIISSGFSTEWFPGRTIVPNQYLSYARILYQLYEATEGTPSSERAFYLSRANDMHRAFKATVRTHPRNANAYLWNYWEPQGPWDVGHYYQTTNPDGSPWGEDISHAGLTMSGVWEAYRHGQVWSLTDMRRFARTLVEVMGNGSLTDPVLTARNTGTLPNPDTTRLLGGWAALAEFDHRVNDIAMAVDERYGLGSVGLGLLSGYYWNKVINAEFETQQTNGTPLPGYWRELWPATGTRVREQAHATLGRWALTISGNGNQTGLEQILTSYEPGVPYQLLLRGRTIGGARVTADVYDYTAGTSLGSVSLTESTFTDRTVTTVPLPPARHDVRVRVYSAGTAYVDVVRSQPAPVGSEIPGGGFELAAKTDSTLPRYWSRATGTEPAAATLDSVHHGGARSLKLTTQPDGPHALSGTWRGYRPGGTYTLEAFARSTTVSGTVNVVDSATGEQLARLDFTPDTVGAWAKRSTTFRAPDAYNRTLRVQITVPAATAGAFWADEISVHPN